MRNAERFLSQGKIRAAIGEYQRVVENDPKDYSTLNILGDLYAKNHDKQEAVGCFTQVADYYNLQGFAHKAIAVYNKISRIEPNSMEVSAKLAELYQSKGSVAEARVHYTTLAENYQRKGQKIEALAIWKQIAELDRNNTEICLKIAETGLQEEQLDDAAQWFSEAGSRFVKQAKYESALTAFTRSLDIRKNDLPTLKGFVKAQMSLGYTDDAANALEEVLKEQPYNRDILNLLSECYLEMNNAPDAERTIVKLVEQEPSSYPRFLDLVKLYLKTGDVDAAARTLAASSEHLLVGGQPEEFLKWTNEILARNPEQLDALRLLADYHRWLRDEPALLQSLQMLAETARLNDAVEEEHYALSQLVTLAPQEMAFAARLQEINHTHGFATAPPTVESNFVVTAEPHQNYESPKEETNGHSADFSFADVQASYDFESNGASEANSSNGANGFEFYETPIEATIVEDDFETNELEAFESSNQFNNEELKPADELALQKELESIAFYVEQDYKDLAAKSLDELEGKFGRRSEIVELRRSLNGHSAAPSAEIESAAFEDYSPTPIAESPTPEYVAPIEVSVENYPPSPTVVASKPEKSPIVEEKPIVETAQNAKVFESLDDLKNEFAAEDAVDAEADYETHYHLATAYREMGLTEKAIKEFQDAINLVEINDSERRYFQCATLLGHCFMDKRMPNPAMMWFNRALAVGDLDDEEKQALYYEIGSAFEMNEEPEKAADSFEKLYAENVNFRDVGQRLEHLRESVLQTVNY